MADITSTAVQTGLQTGVVDRRSDAAGRGRGGGAAGLSDDARRSVPARAPENAAAAPARHLVAPRSIAESLAVQLAAQEQKTPPQEAGPPDRDAVDRGIRAYRGVQAATTGHGADPADDLIRVGGPAGAIDITA